MRNLNNTVQLIGNLGATPEIRETKNGHKMAKLSIATNSSYKNSDGERIKETQWHQLVAWGNLATIAEKYLQKGQHVAVEGKLVNNTYTDKSGNIKYVNEIVLSGVHFLGKNEVGAEA